MSSRKISKEGLSVLLKSCLLYRLCKLGSVDAFLSDYMCCVFSGIGWRAEVHPRTHPVSELEFDVIIGADGRRNTLPGKFFMHREKEKY